MNRRGVLKALFAGAAVVATAPVLPFVQAAPVPIQITAIDLVEFDFYDEEIYARYIVPAVKAMVEHHDRMAYEAAMASTARGVW